MRYDNDRDRLAHGFDAGMIVDGVVTLDPESGRLVLVDEDGVGFDPQAALKSVEGKRVRLTLVSFDAMQNLEELLSRTRTVG
jgi:hypothetical protein